MTTQVTIHNGSREHGILVERVTSSGKTPLTTISPDTPFVTFIWYPDGGILLTAEPDDVVTRKPDTPPKVAAAVAVPITSLEPEVA